MEKKQTLAIRLDENVILVMLVAAVLAAIVMMIRYKNYAPCMPFNLTSRAGNYYTGEVVRFETNAKKFRQLQWSFGDNQSNETAVGSAVHAYDQPGEYTVSLTVNGECTEYKTIYITRAPRVVDSVLLPKFVFPQSAEVGKPVNFEDTTHGASTWEWRFGETAGIDATARNPDYVYRTPGLKTISLVINNNPLQLAVGKVYVNPAPPPPVKKPAGGGAAPVIVIQDKPTYAPISEQLPAAPKEEEVKKAPDIDRAGFEAMLRAVANNYKNAESFNGYLCNNLNIQVSLNGTEVTFSELCNKLASLKSEKKIKRLNVQMVKNEKTNCIVALVVDMKLRGNLFEKIF
ncbi:hypothetical protein SAMN05421788_104450 [Filimonas lacunae]|uniref:PKD domain-containing protein n=1 Tax=Filimonas lacunae TaxID=477680 RepID=A0A173MRW1_9BACT|nr:PKD domain-containing protein [Filimonas lacunae]BAV10180.1 cell surface protein [Filimonas lacunae]SIT18550.1 hypothetical protein SAMN05421788_104450 [Filimonas lacunae]